MNREHATLGQLTDSNMVTEGGMANVDLRVVDRAMELIVENVGQATQSQSSIFVNCTQYTQHRLSEQIDRGQN